MRFRFRFFLLACLLSVGACQCESRRAEQRRVLLTPKDRMAERRAYIDKHRLTTPDGALRASDEVVAGVRLPRGLKLHREFEREWYYRTLHRDLTLQRLEAWFSTQLFATNIRRDKQGSVWFIRAQLKSAPTQPTVTLRIAPVQNGTKQNEVFVEQTPAVEKREYPSELQVEAQLKARRKFAD